jgi:nucleotide-binding universal stress UspA family protein
MTKIQPGSIVVGADGSPDANRAVQWAAEQAALERRPLVLLAAATETPVSAVAGVAYALPYDELMAGARAVAEDAASLAIRHRPGVVPETVTAIGSPRTVLLDATRDAHLVVLGSRGRGPVRSKFLGSVSAAVTKHAECPVVVCRPGTSLRVKNGVVVGADGTATSLPVIEFAFRQASLHSQPLTVLHSMYDPMATVAPAHVVPGSDDTAEQSRLLVAESVAGFREHYPDVPVTLETARGLAAEALVAVADRYDLVVLGRHPVDSLTRRLTGAVATAVLERSRTTIAVVPQEQAG